MGTVTLKSKVGSFEFRYRMFVKHPETGKEHYENVLYEFNSANDFRCAVPVKVWEDVRDNFADNKQHARYSDILQPL